MTLTNVEGMGPWWNTPSTAAPRADNELLVPPTQAAVSVEVCQRDLAGNQGSASTAFAYTYEDGNCGHSGFQSGHDEAAGIRRHNSN